MFQALFKNIQCKNNGKKVPETSIMQLRRTRKEITVFDAAPVKFNPANVRAAPARVHNGIRQRRATAAVAFERRTHGIQAGGPLNWHCSTYTAQRSTSPLRAVNCGPADSAPRNNHQSSAPPRSSSPLWRLAPEGLRPHRDRPVDLWT